MVVLCSIKDLDKYRRSNKDITFAIVRNLKEQISGVQQFTRLAPSSGLYAFAIENKNKDGFWDLYHESFNKELLMHEKQVGLAIIEDLVQAGHEINLVCYCADYNKCHRVDVYNILKSRGIECEVH